MIDEENATMFMNAPRAGREWGRRSFRFIVLSLFFLALALLIFRNIFDGAYLTGTDSMGTIFMAHMQNASGHFFSTWDYYSSTGLLSFPSPAYVASNALMTGLLDISASDYAKLQLLVSFWLAGMIPFYVLRAMVGSDKAAFLGSLAYLGAGAFVNQLSEGHMQFVIGYPFLILIFYLFHDAYNNGMTKKTVPLPALLLVYGGAAAPHMVLLAAAMLVGYAAFELVYSSISRRGRRYIHKIGMTVLFVGVLVGPIAYIMLVLGGSGMYETAYTLQQASGLSDSFLMAIGLGGAELTNVNAYYGIEAQNVVNLTTILAIPLFFFALLSLSVRRYRKLTVPLWLAAAFNIFMAMGPHGPLGFAFTFMFDRVPLVDSFRAMSRFAMINAAFYSVMIAITVANWGEVSEKAHRLRAKMRELVFKGGRTGKERMPSKAFPTVLAAVLVIASLSGLLVVANGETVRGFDVPDKYTEPFEYIQATDANAPSYKILALPMTSATYRQSGDGYPRAATLDPGVYLGPMINGRGISYSTGPPDVLTGISSISEERQFGYQRTLDLLGGSAAVKYVVDQWYAPKEQKELLLNMTGGTVLMTYPSGARVIAVDSFSSPLRAQDGLILGSGGLETMYLLLGAGVFDPSGHSYASFMWSGDADVNKILGASDLVIIQNGDLVELGYELGYMDNTLLHIPDAVNEHREDVSSRWVPAVDIGAGEKGARTSGPNILTVNPDKQVGEGANLKIRASFGPDEGVLRVTINGDIVQDIELGAPFTGTEWVTTELPSDIGRIDSISFTGSSDGREVAIAEAAIFDGASEAELSSQITELLSPYRNKVGYIYTPLGLYLQDRSTQLEKMALGNGLRSESAIGANVSVMFDSALRLSVHSPDWGARDVLLDGSAIAGPWNSAGAYRYELGAVTAGKHELQLFSDGLYGMTLLPDYEFSMVAPMISYERLSPTEYRVAVTNASGPFILKFSEGPSEFWELRADGAAATWFRSDYLANAFIVDGTGDFGMTLSFSKQADYDAFLYLYASAIIASTLVAAAAYACTRWARRKGGQEVPGKAA